MIYETPESLYEQDRIPEGVIARSSIFDETPEGLFYMDRLQRDHDEELSLLSELGRHLHDLTCNALDRALVLGRTD